MSIASSTRSAILLPTASRAYSLIASRNARPTGRHFVALASASSPPSSSLTRDGNAASGPCRRQYSLDRPNSSFPFPLSLFSSSGGGGGGGGGRRGMGSSNDSSPYGQSLEISGWPVTKANTIINIVPQGKRMVVERFGKLHAIHESGYFFAVPFVDSIAYVIDVRERAVDIPNQSAITRDNVSVEVSGNLFVRVADPERAAYGARNPLYAVIMHAQSAMRSAIGELELDEILHNRAGINTLIKGAVQEAA
ncbi:hypothetical protein ACHAW5_004817, partial [Stephanodiscus triporus]